MIDPAARIRVPEHVAHRPFEGETVVLNVDSGQYHGLNPTAARMFTLLTEHGTIRAASTAIAEHYGAEPGQVTEDLQELCSKLHERGLIEIEAATG